MLDEAARDIPASLTWGGDVAEMIFRLIFNEKVPQSGIRSREGPWAIWQMKYARLFNRVYDNRKMLEATGLKQEDFKTLYQGLSFEKESILAD